MNGKTKNNGWDVYTIKSGDGKSTASFVPAKGGVCSSFIVTHNHKEQELLFLHDDFWKNEPYFDLHGGLPLLFPICGRLERNCHQGNYLYNGTLYNLTIHGFASYMPWQVASCLDDKITLELVDNKDSAAHYPFKFKVLLEYQIRDNGLLCKQTYVNLGDEPLIYYAGFHPYFLTPNPNEGKEDVRLNFNAKKMLRYNDALTDIIGERQKFAVPVSITDPNINEQLAMVADDNTTTLTYPNDLVLSMRAWGESDTYMFPYLQIYTKADQPFICLEPWMGHPNGFNTACGYRIIESGKTDTAYLSISVGKVDE
ncbi:MAG: aldose epimerase [Gammaproteobacteria bacterium]|nr:aldose epimerase [Gammaproteobacteria bacterium]